MVHDLGTIKRLNDRAVRKAKGRKPVERSRFLKGLGVSPAALRAATNTPWTKEELAQSGEKCVYESYARSSAEPFSGRGKTEGLQP